MGRFGCKPTEYYIFIIHLETDGKSRLSWTNVLDFSEAINGEGEKHYCVSVTQVSREFLFLTEVLKMFHPPYKSKRHWPCFRELPIQNKRKRIVSPL